VCIHLSDVNRQEGFPDRIITLEHPHWSAEIGRGSSSEIVASPQPANAWFTSKVMSRHHAELKADPKTRMLMIKDKGSMHGTLLNGARVPISGLEVLPDDIITFGTQVVAKDNTFSPLKTSVTYQWTEDDIHQVKTGQSSFTNITNTFTADYSDADICSEYDDEIEVVGESVRQPSLEILQPTFVRPVAASSANTSPRTDSERRTSSITAPTDRSSVMDEAPNRQKDEQVTPSKARVLPIFNDSESETGESLHHPPRAGSALGDDSGSDDGSSLDYNPLENNPELYGFDEEYEDEEEYDQDEEIDNEEQEHGHAMRSEPPLVVPHRTCCSSSVPTSAPLREPSPSDAAMAKPRPSSPTRYPSLFSMAPPPPPITPRPAFSPSPSKSHNLPGASLALSPGPIPCTQPPFTYAPSYQFQSSYPTISNNGPFGYSITSYDPYDIIQSTTPPSFQSSRPSVPLEAMYPPPLIQSLHASPKVPVWAQSANEGPRYCQPTFTLKRKADEMCSDDDDDWSSEGQVEDLDKVSSPRAPLTSPRSPVWQPESPEIQRLRVNVAPCTSEPEAVVSDAVSNAGDLTKDIEPAGTEVPAVESSNATAEELKALVEPIEPLVPAVQVKAVQPPPRKKIKINKSAVQHVTSTARTAMKYAAVALAGGAAAAMGTVYALASLPPDYFASAI